MKQCVVALALAILFVFPAVAADTAPIEVPAVPGPATGLADLAALRATVFGTPPQDIAPLPEKVPLLEMGFALPWARPVPAPSARRWRSRVNRAPPPPRASAQRRRRAGGSIRTRTAHRQRVRRRRARAGPAARRHRSSAPHGTRHRRAGGREAPARQRAPSTRIPPTRLR